MVGELKKWGANNVSRIRIVFQDSGVKYITHLLTQSSVDRMHYVDNNLTGLCRMRHANYIYMHV